MYERYFTIHIVNVLTFLGLLFCLENLNVIFELYKNQQAKKPKDIYDNIYK